MVLWYNRNRSSIGVQVLYRGTMCTELVPECSTGVLQDYVGTGVLQGYRGTGDVQC